MSDLAALARAAAAAWPQLTVPPEIFASYLRDRASGDLDAERAADLYLACACSRGDERAIASLEARYFGEIDRALGRRQMEPAHIAEVKQILRQQLFVAEPGRPPRICEYGGRGDLGAWLRVSAVRQALKLLRRERRELPVEDERMLEHPAAGDDPELALMKGMYRSAFKAAFERALGELEAREQNLLRQHFLDGLTLDELAALHHVHRATAARWLAQARESVMAGTRAALAAHIGVRSAEYQSILRLVRSRFEVTLRRFLKPKRK